MLEQLGITVHIKTSRDLQKSIEAITDATVQRVRNSLLMYVRRRTYRCAQAVKSLILQRFMLAEYTVANKKKQDEWHHFGLAIPYYTHFTSPIRRYADVMVHRALQATLDGREVCTGLSLHESF